MKQAPEVSGPVARLAQSRTQLTYLLGLESTERRGTLARIAGGTFPRSATMRFLCSGRTREAAGLLVLGLLTRSRPPDLALVSIPARDGRDPIPYPPVRQWPGRP
jgi:hypothetical protein